MNDLASLAQQTTTGYNGDLEQLKKFLKANLNGHCADIELVLKGVDLSDLYKVTANHFGILFSYQGDGDGFDGVFYIAKSQKFIPCTAYVSALGMLALEGRPVEELAER